MAKVILACTHTTDGTAKDYLQTIPTDLPILLITRPDGYIFNEEVLALRGKPYLLANFEEMGWAATLEKTHLFGVNSGDFSPLYDTDEWRRLDDFIAANHPVLNFTRELLAKDASETIHPINYPAFHLPPEPQTKQQFLTRPLDVFYTWGYSHPERRRLHGQIFIEANKRDYVVCDNLYFLDKFIQIEMNYHRWLTANIPDYCRFPAEQIISLNGLAKISSSSFE